MEREKEMMNLHDLILSAFRKQFGNAVIGVNLLRLVHECWATVVVKERSPEIEKMAQDLEVEFNEDLDRHISVLTKVSLKNRIRNLIRKR